MEVQQLQSSEILIAKEVLGRGAYGIVLQGFHKLHGNVAVKCAIVKGGRKMEEKIMFEIKNLQRCSHENVVRILGYTIFMKTMAIVMEHLPGGNLMELLLDEEVVLAPILRLRQSAEIASGIAFMHNLPGKRLVHGDVKPENILLTSDLHCKIADFGESKLTSYTCGTTSTDTQSETNKFTKIYAAPELLHNSIGKRKSSHDTYSFGMTLYLILNRNLPVLSDSQMPLYLEAIKAKQRPDESDIFSWRLKLEQDSKINDTAIIDLLIKVMRSCWAHDPLSRPLMITVKEELYSLLQKSHPSELQKHVAEATRTVQFNGQLCSNQLVPLGQFMWPYQQGSSVNDTSSSAARFTAATDLLVDDPSESLVEHSEKPLNVDHSQEIDEFRELERNNIPSSVQTTYKDNQPNFKYSRFHEKVVTLGLTKSEQLNTIQPNEATERDIATETQFQAKSPDLGFSLKSSLSGFISNYLHRENPKRREFPSNLFGSSVDPLAIESSAPQIQSLSSQTSSSPSQNSLTLSLHGDEETPKFAIFDDINPKITSENPPNHNSEIEELSLGKGKCATDTINKSNNLDISQYEDKDAVYVSKLNLFANAIPLINEVEGIPNEPPKENCSSTRPKELYLGPMAYHLETSGTTSDQETTSPLTNPISQITEYIPFISCSNSTSAVVPPPVQNASKVKEIHSTWIKSSSPIVSPLHKGSVANSLIQSLMCSVGAPTPEVATSFNVPQTGDLQTSLPLAGSPTEQRSKQLTYFDLTDKERKRFSDEERKLFQTLEEINDSLDRNNVKNATATTNRLITTTVQTNVEHCEITINSVLMISKTLDERLESVLAVRFIDWCIDFSDHVEDLLIKLDLLEKCCDTVHIVTESMYSRSDLKSIRRFSLNLLGKLHRHKISPLKMYNLNRKAIVETSCLLYIGYCYHYLQKYNLVEEICNACISTLTIRFTDKANEYQLFAHCYYLKAYANYHMQNYTLAVQLYKKAAALFESAQDVNEIYRQEMIDDVRRSIHEAPFRARLVAFHRRLVSKSL